MKHYNYWANEKLEKKTKTKKQHVCATDFILTLEGVGMKKPNMDCTNN